MASEKVAEWYSCDGIMVRWEIRGKWIFCVADHNGGIFGNGPRWRLMDRLGRGKCNKIVVLYKH